MVARPPVKEAQSTIIRLDVLPKATRNAFSLLQNFSFLSKSDWYLAGGTALTLQIGHRKSVDLDFFTTQKTFHESEIEKEFLSTGKWITTLQQKGTLYGKFVNAKISFIAYPFFQPSKEKIFCGHISILAPHDIAAMKIVAISQRGRKRDFVDLYWYCTHFDRLEEVIRRTIRQYPHQKLSIPHIIKSFTYFEDAEADPMPKIFFDVTWKKIKEYFQKEAVRLAKELLRLT